MRTELLRLRSLPLTVTFVLFRFVSDSVRLVHIIIYMAQVDDTHYVITGLGSWFEPRTGSAELRPLMRRHHRRSDIN